MQQLFPGPGLLYPALSPGRRQDAHPLEAGPGISHVRVKARPSRSKQSPCSTQEPLSTVTTLLTTISKPFRLHIRSRLSLKRRLPPLALASSSSGLRETVTCLRRTKKALLSSQSLTTGRPQTHTASALPAIADRGDRPGRRFHWSPTPLRSQPHFLPALPNKNPTRRASRHSGLANISQAVPAPR